MSDQVFQALADERRRNILRLIQNTELSAGEIAGHFDVTQPAISQHLRVLVEAQLVTMRRLGTYRLYRARPRIFGRRGGEVGYRYCHLLAPTEIRQLAEESGFRVADQFTADGGMNLFSVLRA